MSFESSWTKLKGLRTKQNLSVSGESLLPARTVRPFPPRLLFFRPSASFFPPLSLSSFFLCLFLPRGPSLPSVPPPSLTRDGRCYTPSSLPPSDNPGFTASESNLGPISWSAEVFRSTRTLLATSQSLQNLQRCPNSTSSTRKLLGRTWVSVRPSGAERYLLSLLLPPLPVSFLSPPPPSPSSPPPPPCCCSLPRRRGSGSASVSRQRRRTEYGVRGDGIDPRLLTVGRESKEGDCTFVGGGGGDRVPLLPRPTMRTRAATQRGARRADGRRKKSLFGGWCACVHYHCEAKQQHRPTDRPPPGIMLKDGRPPPPRPPSGRETNPDRGGGWMTSTREGEWRGGGGEKW